MAAVVVCHSSSSSLGRFASVTRSVDTSRPRWTFCVTTTVKLRFNRSLTGVVASMAPTTTTDSHNSSAAKPDLDVRVTSSNARNKERSLRTELYPHIKCFNSGYLPVSKLHTLYWEESGNATGQAVVFLHGGPGSGTSSGNRRFFDPDFYRIVLFDQRGAGRSTPHACVEENTTWDLVNDMEKLREHLQIKRWQVFGGSWGSTLALVYTQCHPERVTGVILRGIFLLRKKEIDWFYQGGASAIFPDAWEPYCNFIPDNERNDFVTAYSKRLNSPDDSVQISAAKAWTNWEMATSYLVPNEESLKRGENDQFALAFARVENHYFKNKGFFPTDSFLLDNMDKIRHIRAVIVQGRYDVVCPLMSAWDLHRAWPEADFKLVPTAGHSANEPGIAAELVAACELHKSYLQKGN
ncbi:hypothetical protein BDL97_19G070900 [Sphagnum fallax]|nr:hypothetical protein BDL97_19G070900 [Sphagnum fallax]